MKGRHELFRLSLFLWINDVTLAIEAYYRVAAVTYNFLQLITNNGKSKVCFNGHDFYF